MSSGNTRAAAALAMALALAGAAIAGAQEAPEQMVWLRGGGFVRGSLVELIPGDHVTVRLPTGEVRRFSYADIERTSAVGAAPSAPAPPVGSASASPGAAASAPPTPVAGGQAPAAGSAGAGGPAVPSKGSELATIKVYARGDAVELQGRPRLEASMPWLPVCAAPCGSAVRVGDLEFRVAGEGISPSNTFVIEPGDGAVKLDVNAGSAGKRRLGRLGLFIGVPMLVVGAVGMGIDAGTAVEHRATIGTAGLISVIVGGALTLASLPLVLMGSTRVRNQKGELISLERPAGFHF
jgi:hypothetical protein